MFGLVALTLSFITCFFLPRPRLVNRALPVEKIAMNGGDGEHHQQWDAVPSRKRERRHKKPAPTGPPDWMLSLQDSSFVGDEAPPNVAPSILVLMGLPGSGKSTLAEALCQAKPHSYVRVNQDSLGNRQKCLKLAERCLNEGKSPIVDRCNASAQQRQHWTQLAAKYAVHVDCIVLDVPERVCIGRCRSRGSHPTLSPNQAVGVIKGMQREWELPDAAKEGFRSVAITQNDASLQEAVEFLLQN